MTAPASPAAAGTSTRTSPNPPADTLQTRRQYRFFQYAAVGTVAMSCAIAFSLNLVDPDLWGHVKYGQEVISEGELPRTATHTYTAVDHRWINHENLAEITFALVYEYLGNVGLTVGKCLLGMGILGLMVLSALRRRVGPLVAWAFLLLVAVTLATFFPVRPQLFSFALCAVMLFLLELAFPEWPNRLSPRLAWLWCLPPLMVVWVNSHGGFVAGLAILLTYLAGRSVELLYRQGTEAWRTVGSLAAVGAASLAAVLVNPYVHELPLWLVQSLGRPRPEITEWAAPSPGDPMFVPFALLLALFVLSTLLDRRRRDWTHVAILALVGWQSLMHVRHVAFFAILCGFWLPGPVSGLAVRLRGAGPSDLPEIMLAPWLRRSLIALLGVVFCLQTYALASRVRTLPVYRHMYPVDAVEYMAEKGLKGRLVVAFNWAQYAIAALSPEIQVQFDGRFRTCYPQRVIDRHFDFLLGEHEGRRFRSEETGPIDGTAVLAEREPNLVLLDRSYPAAVEHMEQELAASPGKWVLLYQDGVAQLYGRSDAFDDPASPHYVAPGDRVVSDVKHTDYVPWPALPARAVSRFAAR